MRLLALFVCLSVGCVAQRPKQCTSPPLLTGGLSVRIMYKINSKNHTCCKRPLDVNFHPLAIPQNASLLAQVVLGSSSGPGQGVLVNTWVGEQQMNEGKAKYMSTVTEFGCIPVSTLFHTRRNGWMVTSFFNNIVGIADPLQLIPPPFCKDAQLEEEDGQGPATFFSVF
ncbi:ependymin-like isoform X2 [Paralichthys olivaceus]|uniref:ependymin-like isoform X2 n=1 Tax=Paralichthys olivaceus TaxID=8255 RepID=UPI003753DA97